MLPPYFPPGWFSPAALTWCALHWCAIQKSRDLQDGAVVQPRDSDSAGVTEEPCSTGFIAPACTLKCRAGFELFAASKLCEPIFQDLLLRGLNAHKLDSHPRQSGIGYLPQRRKYSASMSYPYPDLGAAGQGTVRLDEAAKDAQVARARYDLLLRIDINYVDPGHKSVAYRAMLFQLHTQSMNLFFAGVCQVGTALCPVLHASHGPRRSRNRTCAFRSTVFSFRGIEAGAG